MFGVLFGNSWCLSALYELFCSRHMYDRDVCRNAGSSTGPLPGQTPRWGERSFGLQFADPSALVRLDLARDRFHRLHQPREVLTAVPSFTWCPFWFGRTRFQETQRPAASDDASSPTPNGPLQLTAAADRADVICCHSPPLAVCCRRSLTCFFLRCVPRSDRLFAAPRCPRRRPVPGSAPCGPSR